MIFAPERGEGFIPDDEMAEMDTSEPEHTEAELEASRAETDRLAALQAAERDKYRPEQPTWKKWLGIGKGKTDPREILEEKAHKMNKEVGWEVKLNRAGSTTQAVENLARLERNVSIDAEEAAEMNEHHRYLIEKYGDDEWINHLNDDRSPSKANRREFRKKAGQEQIETQPLDHTTTIWKRKSPPKKQPTGK